MASANYEVLELQDKITALENKVDYYKNKCYNQNEIIQNLHKVVEELSKKNSKIVDAHTQTDSQNNVTPKKKNSVVNPDETEVLVGTKDKADKRGLTIESEEEGATKSRISNGQRCKVLVVGDSHSRHYGRILSMNLDDCSVTGIVKPNAKLDEITVNMQNDIRKFGKHDFMVVMGGSNNIGDCYSSENIHKVVSDFGKIMDSTKHTNVIISTIPFRCRNREFNRVIEHINYSIYEMATKHDHVYVLCVNNLITVEDYSADGLHLKYSCKKTISEQIKEIMTWMNQHNNEYFLD